MSGGVDCDDLLDITLSGGVDCDDILDITLSGGVDCDDILAAAHVLKVTPNPKDRQRILTLIVNQMHRALASRMKRHVGGVKE